MTPPEALPRLVLERKLRSARRWNLVLGVLAAAGIVFGAVQVVGGGAVVASSGAAAQVEQSSAAETSPLERRIDGDSMAIGSIDAPVVLSHWTDMRCPYCAVFSRDTMPQVIQEYVDSGKVRIEVHDAAFFGEQSERAAVAARAAGEQGKFFEFIAAVYEAAPESGHPELPTEQLIGFAKEVGVPNIAQFEEDLQRDDLLLAVRQSTVQAQQLGVSGVPFFAVGEQAFSGAHPIDSFREFLDPILANS